MSAMCGGGGGGRTLGSELIWEWYRYPPFTGPGFDGCPLERGTCADAALPALMDSLLDPSNEILLGILKYQFPVFPPNPSPS